MIIAKTEEVALGNRSFYDLAEYFCERLNFVFLDSRINVNNLGRRSFLCFDPFLILTSEGRKCIKKWRDGTRDETEGNPFDVLSNILRDFKMSPEAGVAVSPFVGGGIGYFVYELGQHLEVLPAPARNGMNIPECYICFYHFVLIYDHEKRKAFISYFYPGVKGETNQIEQIKEGIGSVPEGLYLSKRLFPVEKGRDIFYEMRSDFTKKEYLRRVTRIKEYIRAGDVYQVNLTHRFHIDIYPVKPWHIYKRLMDINPSPFACYLNFENVCVVSSSPERFLRVFDSSVETRPIKGTIKRGSNPQEDAKQMEYLLTSKKDLAELAMIVDLLRNDLGRVCRPGTIKVKAFPEIETYASLHHLVSTIRAELCHDKTIIDLLKASFPGGSITGAPKIRAMEIINELEPIKRGIYTGSIGYIGFQGNADLNIVIRSIIINEGRAYIHVGGGIVDDSVAEDEYHETLLKGRKLFTALMQ
ncbi:MAG: aminodeoxychorismate synthase component I [Nitrospirae bacterium]|nr:aminodeoxychorismate synthase component I [Nitrospirota bacterium]